MAQFQARGRAVGPGQLRIAEDLRADAPHAVHRSARRDPELPAGAGGQLRGDRGQGGGVVVRAQVGAADQAGRADAAVAQEVAQGGVLAPVDTPGEPGGEQHHHEHQHAVEQRRPGRGPQPGADPPGGPVLGAHRGCGGCCRRALHPRSPRPLRPSLRAGGLRSRSLVTGQRTMLSERGTRRKVRSGRPRGASGPVRGRVVRRRPVCSGVLRCAPVTAARGADGPAGALSVPGARF